MFKIFFEKKLKGKKKDIQDNIRSKRKSNVFFPEGRRGIFIF